MKEFFSVGDYVRFSPYRNEEMDLDDVGTVINIDHFGILEIEAKSFTISSENSMNSYRRFPKDVIKMSIDETMMYLLET